MWFVYLLYAVALLFAANAAFAFSLYRRAIKLDRTRTTMPLPGPGNYELSTAPSNMARYFDRGPAFDPSNVVYRRVFRTAPGISSYAYDHLARIIACSLRDLSGNFYHALQNLGGEVVPSVPDARPTCFIPTQGGYFYLYPAPDAEYEIEIILEYQTPPPNYGYPDESAHQKSIELLKTWLSPEQIKDFEANRYFYVTGSHGGYYRINEGTISNVLRISCNGAISLKNMCVVPACVTSTGDVMLAQKIMLETDELNTYAIANK
jgi:hypothetical protein